MKPKWRPRYRDVRGFDRSSRAATRRTPATQGAAGAHRRSSARQKADSAELDLRFNWDTPFFLSPHNPTSLYIGGNRVLKSTQRGDNLYPISPDLSKKQMAKIDTSMNKTGGITLDATGAETYGTIVALAESYVRPGFLSAGTDDGNVWLTRNDGARLGADPGEPVRRPRRGRRVREPHRAVALRLADVLRHVRQPSVERLHAVRLRDERLRQDVPVDREQPAERTASRTSCT